MADNAVLNAGSGGITAATDDIAGVHWQRVKAGWGADGAANDTSAAAPFPVTIISSTAIGNEDVAVAAADPGMLVHAQRADTPGTDTSTDGDRAPLKGDAAGRIWVNASGVAVPITDNAGSLTVDGTVTVQDGGAAISIDDNGGSITVDGTVAVSTVTTVTTVSAVTAISNALPAGNNNIGDVDIASIAAGNNNIGDVDIASIAAGTNNIGDVDVLTVPADPFGANADAASATGSISAKLRFIAATGIPITGTVTVGSHAVTNAGTFVVQENGTQKVVDDAAFTPGTTAVIMSGYQADETATDSVDEGDGGAARMTLDRKQIVTIYSHAAAGGATPHQNLDVDETEDDVKTSPGKVFWVHAMNLSATKKYLKFYNATAANTTVGSTTPVLTLPLPTMGDTNGAGFTIAFGAVGVQFDTAICIAATTGFAVADTGAPGNNEVIVNLAYL